MAHGDGTNGIDGPAEADARACRFYASILDNSPDLTYVFDRNHRFIYANPVLLQMWGKTWDEAIGKTCLELGYEPWHAAMHDREIEEVVATRAPIRGEVPFTGTFGRRDYDYIFVPVFGEDGEVEAVAGTTRDVTERRQHEDAARHQREMVETLLDKAPLAVVLVDSDMRIREINPIARPVFAGVGQGDSVVGRDLAEVQRAMWPAAFADEVVARFRHTLDTGESFVDDEAEHPRQDRDTTEVYQWRLDRLVLPDGSNGVVCYFRDVSAQVAARRALEASRDALHEADVRKDAFLATLAHELRNPLAPLRSCLDILRRTPLPASDAEQLHTIMARQLQQMVRLVDDLLEVSRVTRGKVALRLAPLEIANAIEHAIETSRPLLDAGRHVLDVELPNMPLVVDGDAVRLAQVLSNLLNNAAKYTDPGGRIRVRAAQVDGSAEVSVEDSGVGIAPDQLDEVFDLFAQGQNARFRDQGGLGVGLWLARQLAELHGGTLVAHSDGPGKGSRFTLRLPLKLVP